MEVAGRGDLSVQDELAIHDLVSRYGHLVDDEAWDRLGEIFSADARLDFSAFTGTPVVRVGLPAIAVFFGSVEHPMAHHVTNLLITNRASGRVKVRTKFLVVQETGNVLTGEYRDLIRRDPEGWRICERRALPPRRIEARRRRWGRD